MSTWLDSFTALMTQWGYLGMFLSAALAGSVVPFSSELVLAGLIKLGLDPLVMLLCATAGNTLGGMTCYYLGSLGRMEWIEKYLHVKRAKIEKTRRSLQGKGAFMAFFAFVPLLGTAISVALGLMRSNLPITIGSMLVGKALRYLILIVALSAVF